MKFLVITLFAVLVAVYASEECDKKASKCIQSGLTAVVSGESHEDICKKLGASIDCLQSVVQDCFGDEPDEEKVEEVNDGKIQLEELFKDSCSESQGGNDSEFDEVSECFAENIEYLRTCIEEGGVKLLDILEKNSNIDDNGRSCLYYELTSSCFVEKAKEKCGEKVSKMLREELAELPDDIEEACSVAEGIDGIELLEKEK